MTEQEADALGYNACLGGRLITSNPFNGFLYRNEPPTLWDAWRKGFRRAEEHLVEQGCYDGRF